MRYSTYIQSRLSQCKVCVTSGLLLLIFIFGCVTVPTQEFDAYRHSFTVAKTATEDVVLSAKVAAKALADHPANPDSATDRVAKLEERINAANERLLAIEIIDRYNTVLVQLAEGKDPNAIQSNLESFGNSLTQFGSSRMSGLVTKAVPYVSIAAEIIALAEETVNREEFIKLVKKGQEPIALIIDILSADADNIHKIIEQQLAMKRDPYTARIDDLKFKFQDTANLYMATQEITDVVERMNDVRAALTHRQLSKATHVPGQGTPTTSDLALLRLIVDTTAREIDAANIITTRIADHENVIDEYKKLLEATRRSFVELERAVESNRRAATVDFINRALALREAILKLREGM